MALLVDIDLPEWIEDEEFRDYLLESLPGADIRCFAEMGELEDIEMLACVALRPGLAARLPNLKLVQKLGAGVETIVSDPTLPSHVRVARLRPDPSAQEIVEYCLLYVLSAQRHLHFHADNQAALLWKPKGPRPSAETAVGILGLGYIGTRTADAFQRLGYRVLGWSRSPKALENIDCRHGEEALRPLLSECDYVISILPSTPQTRDLFNAETFAAMKDGSWLINVGRGDSIVDADLLAALDAGQLAGAVLDVFREEPLGEQHPFWRHPKVTITPHVSGWNLGGGLSDVRENYMRLQQGDALLYEVDRVKGY
jgi:glyoxylate/hydroxypyruvate reductase A